MTGLLLDGCGVGPATTGTGAGPAKLKPTYFGSSSTPVDNGTGVADPTTVVPPASMLAGDIVIILATARALNSPVMVAGDGQTWNIDGFAGGGSVQGMLAYCIFNGTWSANPAVDFNPNTTLCNTVVMHVFRPNASATTVSQDQGAASALQGAALTQTRTGQTPVTTTGALLAIAVWASADDNTWGTLSGTAGAWTIAGSAQYRNASGSQTSIACAYQAQDSVPVATGDVSLTQLTNGSDATITLIKLFALN